jgi:anti-anti-sigma factor
MAVISIDEFEDGSPIRTSLYEQRQIKPTEQAMKRELYERLWQELLSLRRSHAALSNDENWSGVVMVDVSGRLCFLETALLDRVNELLGAGHREFVLNLANVPYIDSFGLGQLIAIWTSIGRKCGQMTLIRPTDHVRITVPDHKARQCLSCVRTGGSGLKAPNEFASARTQRNAESKSSLRSLLLKALT